MSPIFLFDNESTREQAYVYMVIDLYTFDQYCHYLHILNEESKNEACINAFGMDHMKIMEVIGRNKLNQAIFF